MNNAEEQAEQRVGPGYYRESKSFALSIVSILPLIVLYHCGIVQSSYPVRNLAEVWLAGPLQLVGLHAAHILNIALIIALVAVLWRSDMKRAAGFPTVVLMIVEAGLYAALLYKGGDVLTRILHERASGIFFAVNLERFAPLLLALGAGVYEELLFRLLLVGGGSLLLSKVFLWNRNWSLGVALIVSSLLFAAAHHVGPIGEPFNRYNFLFRSVCGVLLGLVYVFRGLGIAVWTHAMYNALVVL